MTLKLFTSLIIMFCSGQLLALTVISDLDDTVKITHVNTPSAIYNGIFSHDVFLGMAELIQSFKQIDASRRIIFVSGSPKIIKHSVQALLKTHRIPADEIHLVNGSQNKLFRLHQLLKDLQDEVVLLGDDQEHDPEFYQELKNSYPQKIKAIYIHQLNNRILPLSQRGFITAYEVALFEQAAGRLDQNGVEKVYSRMENDLTSAEKDHYIFRRVTKKLVPTWSQCVKHFSPFRIDLGIQSFLSYLERIYYRNCQM